MPEVRDGITIYSICTVMNEIDPMDQLAYDQSWASLCTWMFKHNATYYGAPREIFSKHDAVVKAKAEGKSAVVVEDLS